MVDSRKRITEFADFFCCRDIRRTFALHDTCCGWEFGCCNTKFWKKNNRRVFGGRKKVERSSRSDMESLRAPSLFCRQSRFFSCFLRAHFVFRSRLHCRSSHSPGSRPSTPVIVMWKQYHWFCWSCTPGLAYVFLNVPLLSLFSIVLTQVFAL